MNSKDLTRAVSAKADLAWPRDFGQEDGHPSENPLESAAQRTNSNLYVQILPKEDVVLEINRDATQFDVKHRHQFAFDVIRYARISFVAGGGWFQDWNGHVTPAFSMKIVDACGNCCESLSIERIIHAMDDKKVP